MKTQCRRLQKRESQILQWQAERNDSLSRIIAERSIAGLGLVAKLYLNERLIVESERYEGNSKFILLEEGVYAQLFITSKSDKIL